MQAHPHHDFVLNHAIILKENDLFWIIIIIQIWETTRAGKRMKINVDYIQIPTFQNFSFEMQISSG